MYSDLKLGRKIKGVPGAGSRNRETRGDKVFNTINNVLLIIFLLMWVYPLYFVLIASISNPYAVWRGEVILFPKDLFFSGYTELLHYNSIWTGYLNSIIYTTSGVLINMTLTILGAYALSRPELMIRNILMKIFLFTMFFSGGLIPSFILVKDLGLYNTMWALILPGAISTYNLIIMRSFFNNALPNELREAALLDGCGEFQFLLRIALPLSKAVLSVIALYYAMGHWNSYFSAMIYLEDVNKQPLQLVLRNIMLYATSLMDSSGGDEETLVYMTRLAEIMKYCAIIIASIPPLIIYPFVQKSFVKGVMIGSVKG